jgi:oxygen-independent coproporphyrinogen-3 oxidase
MLIPAEDEFSLKEYDMLIEMLQQGGFEHYEISNFAQPGYYSKHNSSYWKGASYLGVGPSAHSYNQQSRQYNIANNAQYIKALQSGKLPSELEKLSKEDHFNEAILTGLRTIWGVNQDQLFRYIPSPGREWETILKSYQDSGHLTIENKIIRLTDKGKRLADRIAADLFLVD